jgi:phage-related protein
LNLILSKKEIGAPPVKENKLEIEGADGSIDLTEVFGRPTFGDVTHKFTFTSITRNDSLTKYSMVKNALHGKKLRIILDDDPGFYYVGRCYVSSYTDEKGIGTITVECDCEPYKYKLSKTIVTRAVDGTEAITLTNGRKRAVPEITIATDTSLNIVYQTVNIWDLGSGSYTMPDLELVQGDNVVTVTGTGEISFVWRDGEL